MTVSAPARAVEAVRPLAGQHCAEPLDRMLIREWTVLDLDEQSGLLSVSARLDEVPDEPLAEAFGPEYSGPPWPSDLEPPLLEGARLSFQVRPEAVARYSDALLERIEAANKGYAEVILPRIRAEDAAIKAKEQERIAIIAQVQLLLDARLPSQDPMDKGSHCYSQS